MTNKNNDFGQPKETVVTYQAPVPQKLIELNTPVFLGGPKGVPAKK